MICLGWRTERRWRRSPRARLSKNVQTPGTGQWPVRKEIVMRISFDGRSGKAVALLALLATVYCKSQTRAGQPQSVPPDASAGSAAEESFQPESSQAGSRRDPGP